MILKSNISLIIKQVFKYFILNGLEALIPFAFLIILTRFLSTDEYGVWALFVSLYSFMMPLIGGRFDDAVRMHYNDLDVADLRKFVISTFVITSVLSLIFSVLVYFFQDYITSLVKIPENWLLTIIITAYLSAIFEVIRAIFQFRQEVKLIMYMVMIKITSILLCTFILLQKDLTYGAPIIGTILGTAIAIIAMFLLYNPIKFLQFKLYFGKKFYKKLARFFFSYLPNGFGVVIIVLTDRLLISHFANIQETGLYSIASLYGAVLTNLVTRAFILAWTPWLFNNLKKTNSDSIKSVKIVSISYYICLPIIGFIIWQLSLLFSDILMPKDFTKAGSYVLLLIIAAVFQSYFLHNQAFLHYLKKPREMSFNMTIVVIANVILSYFGIIYFGVEAVAYATIISYYIGVITSSIMARKFFKEA